MLNFDETPKCVQCGEWAQVTQIVEGKHVHYCEVHKQ